MNSVVSCMTGRTSGFLRTQRTRVPAQLVCKPASSSLQWMQASDTAARTSKRITAGIGSILHLMIPLYVYLPQSRSRLRPSMPV